MEALDLALHTYWSGEVIKTSGKDRDASDFRAEQVLNSWAKFMVALAANMHVGAPTDSEKTKWSQIRESAQEWLDWRPPKVTVTRC